MEGSSVQSCPEQPPTTHLCAVTGFGGKTTSIAFGGTTTPSAASEGTPGNTSVTGEVVAVLDAIVAGPDFTPSGKGVLGTPSIPGISSLNDSCCRRYETSEGTQKVCCSKQDDTKDNESQQYALYRPEPRCYFITILIKNHT